MRRALDYAHLPPPALPLRFFLAAPWFGVAAGLLLAWRGADAHASRWSPAALAVTHLLTLGYLGLTMAGALLQMLPAVAGLPLRLARAGALAAPPLAAGALLLAGAFLAGRPALFAAAAITLGAAFALLLACLVATLAGRADRGAIHVVRAMRGAVAALAGCVTAGLLLAAWLAGGPVLDVARMVDIHAALGLVGWIACLVLGVSLQVIPMFGPTDPFPAPAARLLAPALALALGAWLACRCWLPDWRWLPALAAALVLAIHTRLALALLARRERSRRSPLAAYWRLALASLLGAAALMVWPGEAADARALAIGTFVLAGYAMAAVNGMLYQIVPFLLWFHLRERAQPGARVPRMADLVDGAAMARQRRWHAAAVGVLLAACVVPRLAVPGGVLLAVACARLGADLGRPVLRQRALLEV